MSEEEGGIKLEATCPKCSATPLVLAGDKPFESVEEFHGAICASCGNELSKEEVESAFKSALDKFMIDRFKR